MELVRDVTDTLAVPPADRRAAAADERLGDEHVVVHRDVYGRTRRSSPGRRWSPGHAPRAHRAWAVGSSTPAPARASERTSLFSAMRTPSRGRRRAVPRRAAPGRPGRRDRGARRRRGRSASPAARVSRRVEELRVVAEPARGSTPSRSQATWCSAVATSSSPLRSNEQSMPYCATAFSIASRFSAPSRSRVGISSANRAMPLSNRGSGSPRRTRRCARTPRPRCAAPRAAPPRARGRAPSPAGPSRARCTRRPRRRGPPRQRRPAAARAAARPANPTRTARRGVGQRSTHVGHDADLPPGSASPGARNYNEAPARIPWAAAVYAAETIAQHAWLR